MSWISVFALALQTAVGFQGASYALAATGLNLQFGYTGLSNFGHVGFLMMGAYGMAIASDRGWSIWVGLALGIGAAVLLGLALGIPTLRLRADYLSDGKLTGREYRDLRRRQEKAAWNIINEKYDGWRRLRFLPRVGR